MTATFFAGMGLSLGLILAIGAQNAYVLRQGLRREHVFVCCLFCSASDAILIAAGVSGFALVSDRFPWFAPVMRWGGVAFLVAYGLRALWAALRNHEALRAAQASKASLAGVLLTLAAITWLNPHVYLDTVVLLGAVAAQYPGRESIFGAGAVTGSFLFFFALGYGARVLAPIFARPAAWRWLDGAVAVIMLTIAARLAFG